MHREFDVSEMSFAKVIGLHASGDRGFVPLPVFPSRVFRHSSIYVRADSALAPRGPGQQANQRAEWAQTAAVYSRGMLRHDCGVDLRSIEWFRRGERGGTQESSSFKLPPGINLTVVPDRSLSQMLVEGSLDAVLSARPPHPFVAGDGAFVACSPTTAKPNTHTQRERAFSRSCTSSRCAATLRSEPWIAMNLYKAFDEAKQRSVGRARDITASFFPLPWIPDSVEESEHWLGGIRGPTASTPIASRWKRSPRMRSSKACARARSRLDELFPPEVQARFRI